MKLISTTTADPIIPATADSAEVARKDALEQLNSKKTNIIAMSVAEGEDALKAAAPTAPGQSRLRGLLEDKEHMKAIGRMTMVGTPTSCRYCSMRRLLSNCRIPVARSAAPTEV